MTTASRLASLPPGGLVNLGMGRGDGPPDPKRDKRRWIIFWVMASLFLIAIAGQVITISVTTHPLAGAVFILPELILGRCLRYSIIFYLKTGELLLIKPEDERVAVEFARTLAALLVVFITSRQQKPSEAPKNEAAVDEPTIEWPPFNPN